MTVQDTKDKPVPIPTQADRPYWDALRERKVVFSRCTACGSMTQRLPMVCTQCQGEAFEWSQVSGRGTIYSFSVARQTWVPAFRDQLPYVVVAVAISEQPSLVVTTNLVGDYELAPGLSIAVTRDGGQLFAQVTGQPKFEIFPESETRFFLKVVDAEIDFVRGADGKVTGLVLHQGGRDVPGKRKQQ